MKVQYIAELAALMIVITFAWKSYPGRSVQMEAIQLSHPKLETEDVISSPPTAEKSDSAFVAFIVFFILCLVCVIAFVVWISRAGKRLKLPRCMDEMLTRFQYCRKYSKLAYSDDEESFGGSFRPDSDILIASQHSVRLVKIKQCISWLYRPISIIWSKYSVQKARRVRPRGLHNLGNTCYFNSVMQTLANTYILQNSIHENQHSGEFNRHFEGFCKWASGRRSGSNSSCYFQSFLCTMIKQYEELPEMHGMFSSRARRFSDYGQHDSHECLRHLLDELRKDERDFRKQSLPSSYDTRKNLTVVDKVFGGHFITVYICLECGSPYHLFEPFLDISLPICLGSINSDKMERGDASTRWPQQNLQEYTTAAAKIMRRLALDEHQFPKSQYSINDCLWYFTRTEHIQDEYLCNLCYSKHDENISTDERLTSATKQTLIFNPPAVLTIHLKRFELKPGRSVKRNDRITYDELLDIAPYCSAYCMRNDPHEQNIWYSLYGIVVHSGSLDFGHYFAYIKIRHNEPDIRKFLQEEYFDRDKTKDELLEMMEKIQRKQVIGSDPLSVAKPNEGIWFCMNDNCVSEVTVDEVLNQEAYLLLYERI